jgi:hypothetical protein
MKKILLFSFAITLLIVTAAAQYTIPPDRGNPCNMVGYSQLKEFSNRLYNLVQIAEKDKNEFGVKGAYPATASYFHLYAKNVYDTCVSILNWLQTGSDNNPEITNYVEGYSLKLRIGEMLPTLISINHWGGLSEIYHKSSYAACGRELALTLLAEAVNLLTYSSRCYQEPYKVKPIPDCK